MAWKISGRAARRRAAGPVFTTITPQSSTLQTASVSTENYYARGLRGLVDRICSKLDSAIAGNGRLRGRRKDSPGEPTGAHALDRVQHYFGDALSDLYGPLELLNRARTLLFSQVYLNSGTFSLSTDGYYRLTTPQLTRSKLVNYAHHGPFMDSQTYGEGYSFLWRCRPSSIPYWFNEGRYAAIAALDGVPAQESQEFRQGQLDGLRNIVSDAPAHPWMPGGPARSVLLYSQDSFPA
jgi:hypothetical protein